MAPGITLGGHSMAVSPMGEVVAQAGEEPDVLVVDIDPGEASRVDAVDVLVARAGKAREELRQGDEEDQDR